MMACQAQGSLQRACEGRDGYSFIGLKTSTLSAFAPIDAAVLKFILLIVLRSPGEQRCDDPFARQIGNSVLSLNGPPEKFSADLFWPN
jgi:hypothetical protein